MFTFLGHLDFGEESEFIVPDPVNKENEDTLHRSIFIPCKHIHKDLQTASESGKMMG